MFSCACCGKKFHKDASLAGKKARCKDCGNIFVIPWPAWSAQADLSVEDRHGLEEVPRLLEFAPPATVEEEPPPILPRRAKRPAPKKATKERASSLNPGIPFFDGLPWFVYLIPPQPIQGYSARPCPAGRGCQGA